MKARNIFVGVFVLTFLFVQCFHMVSKSATAESVSPFAKAICQSFRNSTDEHDMCYKVYEEVHYREDDGVGVYSFFITSKDKKNDLGGVTVKIPLSNMSVIALFHDSYFGSASVSMIKDSIISTLLALGANKEEAESLYIELADSYSGYAYSDIIHFNGYSLFISPDLRELEFWRYNGGFYALRDDEYLAQKINTDEYRLGTKKSLKSPLTKGDKFFISGTVVESEFQYVILDKYAQYIKVLTTDGDYVNMAFYYEEYPFECKIGEQYIFYGKTDVYTSGEAVLWVDLCEIIK